jgi:phenylalanine-4-hydroxylase
MAVGTNIVSAFSGPADYESFDLITHKIQDVPMSVVKEAKLSTLEGLYQEVRDMRSGNCIDSKRLEAIELQMKSEYTSDWLLREEIRELLL